MTTDNEYISLCKRLFSDEERSKLGDILVRELDDYYAEILHQDDVEFNEWKITVNDILRKCNLDEWEYPLEDIDIEEGLYDD